MNIDPLLAESGCKGASEQLCTGATAPLRDEIASGPIASRGKMLAVMIGLAALSDIALTSEPIVPAGSDDTVTATFSRHDPDSKIELDHSMWSDFLSRTVVYAGRSKDRIGRGRKRTWVGSRMRFGNNRPSRYENNRVVLSGFDDAHFAAIRRYREALESVPDQLPLDSLNRDEQLAYWLNLYNVHALEHVAAHYPSTTAAALRSAPGEAPDGVWHERTLQVAGLALSLVDIERRILFPIWDDPLVLYGLWQGAIGGPRLPRRAYAGARVLPMLRENAVEFVNSNRGMDPDGGVLEASLLYGWGAPLFDGPEDIRQHILGYAQPPFSTGLEPAQRVEVARYDWHLADLSGGTHHQGQWNHTAAFVIGLPSDHDGVQFGNFTLRTDATRRSLPAPAIDLLKGMRQFNNRSRETRVTIRECSGDSNCLNVAPRDRNDKN